MNLPKEAGGLGLRNLYIMNEACLMKYGWTLRRGVDTLWSQVLVGKYGRGMIRQGHISVRGADSAFWKAMARVWPYLDTHQFWAVGNGDSIRAWEDKWVSSSLCMAEEVQSIPSSVRDWKVSNMVDDQGQWKITEFNQFLPADIVKQIMALLPPAVGRGDDTRLWPRNRLGTFSISSAYHLLCGEHQGVNGCWKKLWKTRSIERIKVFGWQMLHNKLLTNARKAQWGLGSADCPRCVAIEETCLHVLRDCLTAVLVWQHLIKSNFWFDLFTYDLAKWQTLNMTKELGITTDFSWSTIWIKACSSIWRWQNLGVHDANYVAPMRPW